MTSIHVYVIHTLTLYEGPWGYPQYQFIPLWAHPFKGARAQPVLGARMD